MFLLNTWKPSQRRVEKVSEPHSNEFAKSKLQPAVSQPGLNVRRIQVLVKTALPSKKHTPVVRF